jgi:hypothetical protein
MPYTSPKRSYYKKKSELRRSHESNNTSNRPSWEEYSETSESSEERNREPKHNRRRTEWSRKGGHNSFLAADEEENIMQDTPEAALVAAQAYLLTTQPEHGDPWEIMHQAAIKSLGLIRDELKQKKLWKRRQHITSRQEKEGESPNLREPEDPVHRAGKITRHKEKMHRISSHKLE